MIGGTEILGFSEAVAEQVGLSARAIRRAVTIWSILNLTVKDRLVGTALARKQTELQALSEMPRHKQNDVLDLILGDSPAGNVAQALEMLAGGVAPSATERAYASALKSIEKLPDDSFDALIGTCEARVIASLKRRGVI